LDAFVKIARSEGVLSLWRGLAPSVLMAVPSAAIYFNSYEFLKKKFQDQLTQPMVPMIAGSLARIVTVTVLAPLEFMRTNLQASLGAFRKGNTMREFTTKVIGNSGMKGLWYGLGPTLMRDVPFSAFYWTGYEYTKAFLHSVFPNHNRPNQHGLPFFINFTSGAVSGMIAAIITTPIDVIKTNTQVMKLDPTRKLTAREIAYSIISKEGWKGLTKGMLPRAVKVAPACAIMISSYELLKSINRGG